MVLSHTARPRKPPKPLGLYTAKGMCPCAAQYSTPEHCRHGAALLHAQLFWELIIFIFSAFLCWGKYVPIALPAAQSLCAAAVPSRSKQRQDPSLGPGNAGGVLPV